MWTSFTQVWARTAFGGGYMLSAAVSLAMQTATTSRMLSFDRVYVDQGHNISLPAHLVRKTLTLNPKP